MRFFREGVIYDFMGARRQFVLVSFAFVVISLVLIWKPGPRWGTDFRGGTEIEVAFKQAVDEDQIRAAVADAGFSQPDVIKVADDQNPYRFMLRVQEVSTIDEEKQREIEAALCLSGTPNLEPSRCPESSQATEVKFSPGGDKISVRYREAPDLARIRQQLEPIEEIQLREGENNPFLQNPRDQRVEILLTSRGDQIMTALRKQFGPEVAPDSALRVEWIGPKAGALLRDAAFKSIAIAVIFIMVYIAFRFDLRFAPGAVVGLLHDAVSTVGFLVLLGREVNLTTVAALLTLIGYSVNDTVVVYDRVRETLGKMRGTSFIQIINISLSDMLGRTILTGGTTVIALTAFFIFGTGVLKDFALTLIIGIVLGTYSSIYVALPLTYWLDQRFFSHLSKPSRPVVSKKKASAVV